MTNIIVIYLKTRQRLNFSKLTLTFIAAFVSDFVYMELYALTSSCTVIVFLLFLNRMFCIYFCL